MPSPPRLKLPRVVRTKESFLREIEALAAGRSAEGTPLFAWASLAGLNRRLLRAASQIEQRCRRAGGAPSDLPARSRRAYALLSFLGQDGRLLEHLTTLEGLSRQDPRVSVRLDHLGGLYRIERSGDELRLAVSEGFVGAPAPVLRSLVRLAVPYARRGRPRAVVHEYADGPGYVSVLRELEASGGAGESRPAGQEFDLLDVFEAVNRDYFEGSLSAPRLAWTERTTLVEFGHYEPATDSLRVSRSLDSPEVPRFVLDHVMHHELLHRELGAEHDGARRRFHTARFRQAERRFRHFSEADAFLKRFAARLARRRT